MPNNPLTNVWQFLTATTGDFLRLGNWRYLILALFWALLLASIAVAVQIGERIRRNVPAAILESGWSES